ncbi:MAG: hypothetical protein K9G33_16105 [Sneathiella sp.]|nr:hypothetical protein [Sneathiella sp.]
MTRFAKVGASSIFIFLCLLLILSRFSLPGFHSPTSFLLTSVSIVLLIFFLSGGKRTAAFSAIAISSFFAVLFAWAFATRSLYDPGFDGYAYHLSAIWDISDGWNPFLSPHNNIYVDSYPNGYWVLQSYLVSITGLLLSGQAMIVGLITAVALLAYGFFLDQFSSRQPRHPHVLALLFACIVVANPVVVTQVMTHYVDAPLYLFGCALVFFLMSDALHANRLERWSAVCCIILMVNTKTAALYYAPFIVLGGFVMEMALSRTISGIVQRAFLWIKFKGLMLALALLVGVIAVGYKPYVANILDHGQLLYPSVDKIMKGNEPSNVIPLSAPMKFLYGIFARTDDSLWPIDAPIELKIPGTFKLSEFKYLRFDTRRGGFGPFFSLALLTAFIAYAASRVTSRDKVANSRHRDRDGYALFGTVLIAASMFFPESWWARYVPFTWLSALLFAVAALHIKGKGKAQIVVRILLGITLLAFLGCIIASGLGAFRENKLLYSRTEKIEFITQFPSVKLLMFYEPPAYQDFQSTSTQDGLSVWTQLLIDRGIESEITRELTQYDCDMAGYLDGGIYWCIMIDAMPHSPIN